MVQVYRHRHEVRGAETFAGWIFSIARNELRRHWRQRLARQRIAPMEQLDRTIGESLADRTTWREMEMMEVRIAGERGVLSEFHSWIRGLEPADRELVLLRYVEDLKYEEIAGVLGIPIGTVKWRLFNVRKKLLPVIGPIVGPMIGKTERSRHRRD